MNTEALNRVDTLLSSQPLYNLVLKYRLHMSVLFLLLCCIHYLPYLRSEGALPVLAFFCWHFALYVYNRYTDRHEDMLNNMSEALDDWHARIALGTTVALLAGGAAMLAAGGYPLHYYLLSLPLVFIYGQPLFGGLRIKTITVVKNAYSVIFCWCLPFTLVYLTYGGELPLPRHLLYVNVQLAIIVAIYELFFDIKDMRGDRQVGVITIPVRFGLNPTRVLILLAIACDVAAKLLMYGALNFNFAIFFLFFLALAREDSPAVLYHTMVFCNIGINLLYLYWLIG